MRPLVTVAIPTRNAGRDLARTLEAVGRQKVPGAVELLVCDSRSSDGTPALAQAHGARLIEILPHEFSHGGTRNRLIEEAQADHVAFLTQDAVPADDGWLAALLDGFTAAPRVGLVFGPYRPAPDASPSVARELTDWFASFSEGRRRVDALDRARRQLPARAFLGHLGYFTDANGCVARAAWERVPFRRVDYAEDHLLAQDMLRAGYAKVYVPEAAVIHSHDYTLWQWLRRSFDEARAVREIYGWTPAGQLRDAARTLWGNVGADLRWFRATSESPPDATEQMRAMEASAAHHLVRATGGLLGAHEEALPGRLRAILSLEGRR